ncbi:major capsid protein P2 [Oceanobacter sp. 3_MG-2023]|uniref:major capsid protein P2 n=1 Tax=Oceanobacter sp. 3_MG-2023 TaxID=3062622 RepID=UPI002736B641|nr:major capsid protein P2 [Oceanobacter sp. 3_MG-2023]MDP2505639.1 major capsid protein P2 [Oceanobacter sp. 3_MG-2023]
MQRYIELDSFTAVGAGEVANLVLANGVRYDEIYLETSVPNKVEYVRLTLNAIELFRLSKAELDMLDAHDAVASETGFISIPLAMVQANMLDSQLMTGLVTGSGDNVVLEVKLASDATSPTLKAFANVAAHNGVRSLVRRFVKYTIPVAAAGEVDFTSLVKGPRIMRMFFKSSYVDKLEIIQDMRSVFKLTKARNDMLLKRAGKGDLSGYFVLNAVKRDFPVVDAMATSFQNLNFRLTVGDGGAQNIEVLVEQLEQIQPRDWRNE